MTEQTYLETVTEVQREILTDFDNAFVMGEDVRRSQGRTTIGLVDEFGEERVRDTPISEQAFTGLAIGAAIDGARPILEYQINTLPHVAWEQIVNHAGKIHHMSNGQLSVPITFTIPMGGFTGSSGQHGDNPYPAFMHYGIKTVIPTTPYEVKGLFRSAFEEDDPVMVYLPVRYQGDRGDVPDESYTIPLGKADVKREGDDVTIVAMGKTVRDAMNVAENRSDEVSIEVIDLRSILPLDEETILDSVAKTKSVIIAENANRDCGVASEIAARIANKGIFDLHAPVKRVTRTSVPPSHAPTEENHILPDEETISQAVDEVST
jgi:pyruvate dehydrogenase E1 component beta subunit